MIKYGLLLKLQTYGVVGELLSQLENYLENSKQRVILNDQKFEWRKINSGVPQGSVLRPLSFLIYINDLLHVKFLPMILLFFEKYLM